VTRQSYPPSTSAANVAETKAKQVFESFGWEYHKTDSIATDGIVEIVEEGTHTGQRFCVEIKHKDRWKGGFISQKLKPHWVNRWSNSQTPYFLIVFHVQHKLPYKCQGYGLWQFVSWLPKGRHGAIPNTIQLPASNTLDYPFGKERIRLIVSKLSSRHRDGWNLALRRREFKASKDCVAEGAVLLAQGNLVAAADAILKAKGKTENHSLAFFVAGGIFAQQNRIHESASAFLKAISCQNLMGKIGTQAIYGLIRALRKQGKANRAQYWIRKQKGPKRIRYYDLGMLHHYDSDWQQAIRWFKKAEKACIDENDGNGRFFPMAQRGAVLLDKGDYCEAKKFLETAYTGFKVIKTRSELEEQFYAHCASYLAIIEALSKKIEKAMEYLKICKPIYTRYGNSASLARLKGFEGCIEMVKGNLKRAGALYSQGIKELRELNFPPYRAEMLVGKGLACWKLKQNDEALKYFRAAKACGPTNSNAKSAALAYYYIGKILLARKGDERQGIMHIHIARSLRTQLGFLDYKEIENSCTGRHSEAPQGIVWKAEKEACKFLAPLGLVSLKGSTRT
jgi:tetratricopeptide (TPR) repeat protein